MRALHIAPGLSLPPSVVTQTIGVLGIRGSGKSNAAAVLIEHLFAAGLPFCVVDPTGTWFGLRSSRDGRSAGLPVPIFGGRHGDVPLERAGGQMVADLVAEERLSCVVDVSEFSEGDKTRFLIDFGDRLYRKNQDPLHLVMEEADELAPQRPMREQARLLHVWQQIVRRGRARGLGITMVTQRSAAISKDVLTQIGTLIVLRTTSPQDRRAIEAWVEYHGQERKLVASLPGLEDGEAWVWSPQWLKVLKRVKFPMRRTFDSAATPSDAKGRRRPATLADIDLGDVRKRMADTIERAKATDPRELQRRVAGLERELITARAEAGRKVAAPLKEMKIPKGDLRRVEAASERLTKLCDRLGRAANGLQGDAARLAAALLSAARPTPDYRAARGAAPSLTGLSPEAAIARVRGRRAEGNADGPGLRAGERRMLEVLGRSHPARRSRAQIGTLSGFTPSGGTFSAYWSTLRRCGYVQEGADGLALITGAGLACLGARGPLQPLTTEETLAMWRAALRAGERAMLDELVRAHPKALTREDLGERTGFTASGGTFSAYLSTLRRNGLADVDGDEVRAGSALLVG